MKKITSTEVRDNLAKKLMEIFDTKIDVEIEQNGQAVAILTTKKPQRALAPLRVKSEDAKKNWGELLQAVSLRNARFAFHRRSKSTGEAYQIYLIPSPHFENTFAKRWSAHVADGKQRQNGETTPNRELLEAQNETRNQLEVLSKGIADVQEKLTLTFALINRNGRLYNTPELGVVKLAEEDDLDQYEVD